MNLIIAISSFNYPHTTVFIVISDASRWACFTRICLKTFLSFVFYNLLFFLHQHYATVTFVIQA